VTPAGPRADAEAIFHAAVAAVAPGPLVEAAVARFPAEWHAAIHEAPAVHIVGGGKAAAGMAAGLETGLRPHLAKVDGLLNVPDGAFSPPWSARSASGPTPDPPATGMTARGASGPRGRIRLHPARPAASNHPTAAGVTGTRAMLARLDSAGPADVAICLLSGGGSALLPCPADGVTLADKQAVTRALHAAGATIAEMNAVRKHLSAVKGGHLAAAFRGKLVVGLILSDVVGDPLDVIASGPTCPDPSTFADARGVLAKYGIGAIDHLERGARGEVPETPKHLPAHVHNVVVGNNQTALAAASIVAGRRGYAVVNLGSFVEGETRAVAHVVAGVARSIRADAVPVAPPACVLVGGETTVTLGADPGKGGRNQEFALAMLHHLGPAGMAGVAVLSGGTDGEDGPTDAAGAVATSETLARAERLGLDPARYLARHDSYTFFDAAGGLVVTGLTQTNVADVRVVLVT